jgi:ADP-dependent NAD(P)H-hydrate dehydratase / NAD(P)H-hydrate epimerase
MLQAHEVAVVRAAEADVRQGLPEGTLMSRAAQGLATAVIKFLGGCYGRRVLLVVGSGDNGRDAIWAGKILARRGALVDTIHLGRGNYITNLPTPELVVDGVVGIGGQPGLRDDAAAVFAKFSGVPVIAVDVPSGVDVDTGELPGSHVTAELTVTFGTHKVAHLIDPAAQICGEVTLIDIGLRLPVSRVRAFTAKDVIACLPQPKLDGHKYSRGVVGLRTGSAAYPGAALLSVAGAMCGLAGMVRYDGGATDAVISQFPEVVPGGGQLQAWVTGCMAAPALVRLWLDVCVTTFRWWSTRKLFVNCRARWLGRPW